MLRAEQAVTSLLPLASDIPHPVACMQVGGTDAPYLSALQREVVAHLQVELPPGASVESIERYAFYDQVSIAYAIVVTGEMQPWGNFILHKGVLGEPLRA
jgi:L-fucose mutarotase